MEEWKEYKLGEITNMKNGKKRPQNNGIFPVYGGNGIMDYSDTYNSENAIIVGRVGAYCGCVYKCDGKCWVSDNAISVSAKEIVDTHFLYYLMTSLDFHHHHIGGAQPLMTQDIIGDFTVSIPPMSVQHQIAQILKSLDDKIEVNRRINDNLEQQAQALFKSWFVDFEPFRDQPFVESELGMIPKGWRVGSFLDNINVMPGGTPSTNIDKYWKDGTIPFFSPKDVNGVYCFETEKSITELGLNNCSSRLYPKDTLFITARGTVGKIALAGVPMAMNQSNYALAAKEGVGKFYLYLLTQTLVSTLLKKANGAVFSAITTKDFNEPNLIPAENVMDSFEVLVKPIFDKMFQTCEESRRLAQLRDTLLPRLMSGELSVDGLKGQSAVSPGQRPGAKATSPGQHPGA